METTYTRYLINAKIRLPGKRLYKLSKVIKQQIFVVESGIKHHLIGNVYYTYDTNIIINDVIELNGKCIKPKRWKIN